MPRPLKDEFPKVLQSVRALPQAEKLHLIQVLAGDLAQEESVDLAEGASYPIWTPLFAYEAASLLLTELQKERAPE